MTKRSHQAAIRERSGAFVKDNSTQLALHEMRQLIGTPKKLGGMTLASVLATIMQPFDFRVPGTIGLTLIYWLLIIGVTFPMGFVISNFCASRSHHPWRSALSATVAMAITVTLVVYAMNIVFLGWGPLEAERLGRVFVSGGPVAALVTLLVHLVTLLVHMVLAPGSEGLDQSQSPKKTRLMERLPQGARGPTQHLAAEDHYTRVTTSQGSSLVLLRFSDALQDVAPTPGLQVHRSHWVSYDAIDKAKRRGDAAQLIVTNGSSIPVSRGHMPKLRAKGIF